MTFRLTDYTYDAVVTRVIDGDTVIFDLTKSVDVGFHIVIEVHAAQRVRLARCNCPEHGTPEGDAATAFTVDWLNSHAGTLAVTTSHQDNYGRWVGEVVCTADTLNLSDALLGSGHAVPWPAPKASDV